MVLFLRPADLHLQVLPNRLFTLAPHHDTRSRPRHLAPRDRGSSSSHDGSRLR